jgi:hypothetical protein
MLHDAIVEERKASKTSANTPERKADVKASKVIRNDIAID